MVVCVTFLKKEIVLIEFIFKTEKLGLERKGLEFRDVQSKPSLEEYLTYCRNQVQLRSLYHA